MKSKLTRLIGAVGVVAMTGALLGAAPPLLIYAFLMDYYIAGLTAGATKG